jgi:hypothetical protein
MCPATARREDVLFSLRKQEQTAEQAFVQLNADEFFSRPGEHCDAGNLKSSSAPSPSCTHQSETRT